ncbi:MAG: Trk system potassium transporter TrkA [Bacteroidales bacterium]|nr:Trk system potassium transporter TrkA [Bacteroidales bacterium]MDD2203761.1 Trk system potassium transporter TrkA [Bacteroidales bacterium]MDD3152835.1 Trk system potassium transporter TrkA [Bacteroidales bacterium]MDD3913300.1 Trk system potassium transporter TrkA [Bacteroidales bacterium]MDD4633331.1 Trk system potassium transporter TrkA [Bacteroidales bacterium]
MNIVIAGDGEVGAYLAKLLTGKDHNIFVIDSHEKNLESIESHNDLIAVEGDSTSIEVLKNANVKNADLLISVVHDEKVNIVTCILGKKMGASKTIARVNNLEYFKDNCMDIFAGAGIDAIVCPERIAANECIDLISHSAATEVFDFSGKLLSLMLFHLDDKSKYLNKTIKEFMADDVANDYTIMAIARDNHNFIPKTSDVLKNGDYIYTLTKPRGKKSLINAIGKDNQEIKNLMIVGGGRIGRMMASQLQNTHNIKIIEKDIDRCNKLASSLQNCLIINGDSREVEMLEDENISGMDAFVAVTDNSETNILTCMLAKRYGVNKVIALMDNVEYIDLAQRIGIDGILNKKLITASYMTRYTLDADVSNIKCLNGIDAEILEIRAKKGSYITKKAVGNLHLPEGIVIGGVIREYESHIVTDDFQIRQDDKVVVLCFPDTVQDAIKLFNKQTLF